MFPDLFNAKNKSFVGSVVIVVRFDIRYIDVITHFVETARWRDDLLVEGAFDRCIFIQLVIDDRIVENCFFRLFDNIHVHGLAVGDGWTMCEAAIASVIDERRR